MRRQSGLLRDGDQLRLDLYRGTPWDGISPRGLTRSRKVLFLRQEPPCHEVYKDILQIEMWPEGVATQKQTRPRYAGAPLLLPLDPRSWEI